MGLADAAEQLRACQDDAANYDREIRDLRSQLEAAGHRAEVLRGEVTSGLARADVLELQVAELEHENARLEGALRERLAHDSHAAAAAMTGDFLTVPTAAGEEGAAAVRMLAAIIRNLPAIPPERLDAVADLLTPPA